MLFGFLHRVTIAVIDLKETIIFMVLYFMSNLSGKLCKSSPLASSICALYISAVSPIFVVLQPNLQDMLTIAQRTCTLNFVFLSASLLHLACFQVGIMAKIYAN